MPENVSAGKCFLPEILCVENSLYRDFFLPGTLSTREFFRRKHYRYKEFPVQKFPVERVSDRKILWQKEFPVENFSSRRFFRQKVFPAENVLVSVCRF